MLKCCDLSPNEVVAFVRKREGDHVLWRRHSQASYTRVSFGQRPPFGLSLPENKLAIPFSHPAEAKATTCFPRRCSGLEVYWPSRRGEIVPSIMTLTGVEHWNPLFQLGSILHFPLCSIHLTPDTLHSRGVNKNAHALLTLLPLH